MHSNNYFPTILTPAGKENKNMVLNLCHRLGATSFPSLHGLPVLIFLLLSFGFFGCGEADKPSGDPASLSKKEVPSSAPKTCKSCHSYRIDSFHNFPCEDCHHGTSPAATKEQAHNSMSPKPASPANMAEICGRCHTAIREHVQTSKHFTLLDEINLVRRTFGALNDLPGPEAIPQSTEPGDLLAISDDLLRRRCLRCHPYSSGDQYPGTTHGQGCAACHLKFSQGSLASHIFIKEPDDQICLSCHNGNFVGADYYGLFEHDYSWEYQTPFSGKNETGPGFGVNQHQLRPDLHKSAGLSCIDCHYGDEIMETSQEKISCLSCHQLAAGKLGGKRLLANIKMTPEGSFVLSTKMSQKNLSIPQIKPKHHSTIDQVSCQVCHAQWSFSDYGTHLIRIDNDAYSPWIALTKQGSSEVEQLLEYNLFYDNDSLDLYMRDKFTGKAEPGLWLKGYELRRWEDILTCYDAENVLHVCRPILDLHLSYVDRNGAVIFDSAQTPSNSSNLRPYSPHTIGKAGSFNKFAKENEEKPNNNPLALPSY